MGIQAGGAMHDGGELLQQRLVLRGAEEKREGKEKEAEQDSRAGREVQ